MEQVEHRAWVVLPVPRDVARRIAFPGGVRPGRLHLTAAALAHRPAAEWAGIEDAVGEALSGLAPLPARLAGCDAFPGRTRTWLVARVEVPGLEGLRARLRAALGNRWPVDDAPPPHVTLGPLPPGGPHAWPLPPAELAFDAVELSRAGRRTRWELAAAPPPGRPEARRR